MIFPGEVSILHRQPNSEEAGAAAPVRNVVAFGHGKTAGGAKLEPAYNSLLSTLASYGLIAIAPLSCPEDLCLRELAEDLGTVLDAPTEMRKRGR